MGWDLLVVGAGYSGSVVAERMASSGFKVLVIDRRPHIAGNAYDYYDTQGIRIHCYGPHIFHTNAPRIFEYLSQFTAWRSYEHRVRSWVDGRLYPFPINRDTLNQLYNLQLHNDVEAQAYLESVRVPQTQIVNSEQVVLNAVGWDLYQKFFYGYTKKQWGLEPSEIKAGVAARIPVRSNQDDRYFTDEFQAMPKDGYTAMFERLLAHKNIELRLSTDYRDLREQIDARHVVYTGPIDEFFDYRFGKLPYRSLRFEPYHLPDQEFAQEVGTVNYPNDFAYTRITEFKHLTGQQVAGTSLVKEYPQAEGEPYYPILTDANMELFHQYQALAKTRDQVTFVGRLAQYRYYNMDQAAAAGLKAAEYLLEKFS